MALIESVVKLLLEKIADQVIHEAIFLGGVGDQVEWLKGEFGRMQSFLKDADAKEEEGDARVKKWVQDVRDAAYDAEDAIDTFVFKTANSRQSGFVGCLRRSACVFNELIARHEVGSKIERIKTKMHAISDSRSTYGIKNIGPEARMSSDVGPSRQERRRTYPNVQETDFVGFENDLKALVAQLTNQELRRCVVSIVEMGGIGKTTLTKKLYNNDNVKKHFEAHAWISISQEYSLRNLLLDLAKQFRAPCNKDMEVVELTESISDCLNDKRYLVVLDDIWQYQAWEDLKNAFPDKNNGSRVVLTSRSKGIGSQADIQNHDLRLLKDNESWELFCKKTFGRHKNICHPDLEQLKKEIVTKCCGLPLAVVVIGGLLSRREQCEWLHICKSISWQLVKGEFKISSILSLSYKDLPHYLKPCFLYLGNFPVDHEIHTKELIQMWSAEGFLQQREEQTFEEVGEEYLMELIQRSMVQVSSRSSRGY